MLCYRGQSVGETKKQWLLCNNFLQLIDGMVLNRPSICLNYTSKSTLVLTLWVSQDGLDLKQFIYSVGRNV